jgi:hypothetical protein
MAGSEQEYARLPCGEGTDIFGLTLDVETDNDGRVIVGGQPFEPREARNLLGGLILAINLAEECLRWRQARQLRDVGAASCSATGAVTK